MKKLFILPLVLALLATTAINAQDNSSKKIGLAVGASASTNGLGFNVIAALSRSLSVRVGYESLAYTMAEPLVYGIEDIDFNITPNIKTGGITANVDLYLLKGFYLTGGVVQTTFDMGVNLIPKEPMKIGEIEYQPQDIGELTVSILPERKLSPYAGLGFGRTISRDKKLAMNFELGAYHMGSYVIGMSGTGLLQGNSDNESVKSINTVLSDFSWSGIYPVVKLGLSFRIF